MTLIRQLSNNDCTVAALAMYTGKSYDEVYKHAEHFLKLDGIKRKEFEIIAACLGIKLGINTKNQVSGKSILIVPIFKNFEVTKDIAKNESVQVSISGEPSTLHAMYTDGHTVYDPENNRTWPVEQLTYIYPWFNSYSENGVSSLTKPQWLWHYMVGRFK